jgi:glycosyltransferase involved in cell wall biosynthesis
MKILFINETSGFAGGLEQYLFALSKALWQQGHHCILIYSKNSGKNSDQFGRYFSSKYQINFSNSPDFDYPAWQTILHDESPDIAFLHKVSDWRIISEANRSLPTVRMIHDVQPFCLSSRKYHYFSGKLCNRKIGCHCYLFPGCYRIARGKLARIAHNNLCRTRKELKATSRLDQIIVASHYMKNQLTLNGCKGTRLIVLPLFVESLTCGGSEISNKNNLILFIGNINNGKGLDLLLRALKLVTAPFKFVIIGNGKALHANQKLAEKLGLASKTKFAGWLPQQEIKSYYQQAAMLAMPSRWPEPFGLVGLEAMAHAVPVIGFKVGGIPDWLEDGKNGFLIERGNIRQMAEKIDLLLTDKALNQRLGEYGRQCAITKYNVDNYINKLIAIFEQAIMNRRGY